MSLGVRQVILAARRAGVAFHAWVQCDDRRQSRPAPEDDRTHTPRSISCGARTLSVGAYDARFARKDLSSFTSKGPTRDGKARPEVSAPGHDVLLTHRQVTALSGTSMAAPHVTGLVAPITQAAGRPLTTGELRKAVGAAARVMTNSPWHSRYGSGRIDAADAVRAGTAPGANPGRPDQPVAASSGAPASLDDLLAVLVKQQPDSRPESRWRSASNLRQGSAGRPREGDGSSGPPLPRHRLTAA